MVSFDNVQHSLLLEKVAKRVQDKYGDEAAQDERRGEDRGLAANYCDLGEATAHTWSVHCQLRQ